MKYRLSKAYTATHTIYNVAKTKTVGGRDIITYSNYMKLVPGEEYETDDPATIEFFRTHKEKLRHNPQAEKMFVDNHIPYEVEYCKSCGGRVKKIVFHPVEVYDE